MIRLQAGLAADRIFGIAGAYASRRPDRLLPPPDALRHQVRRRLRGLALTLILSCKQLYTKPVGAFYSSI